MSGIFISYRREDAPGHAGRIFDRLSECFGNNKGDWVLPSEVAQAQGK